MSTDTAPACPFAEPVDYPFDRASALHPAPAFDLAQGQPGLMRVRIWNGQEVWLATRDADVRAVLSSPHASSDYKQPGFPPILPHRAWRPELGPDFQPLLTDIDDPQHARLRRLIGAEFSVKRVRRMEERLQVIISEALDGLEAAKRPADLSDLVLKEVPSQIICWILGFPQEENAYWRTLFERWVSPATSAETRAETHAEMQRYVAGRIEQAETNPSDDFISRLVAARDAGQMNDAELLMLVFILYAAGFDTSANSMALSALLVMQTPGLAEQVRDPDLAVGSMVEELLRMTSVIQHGVTRLALGGPIETPSGVIAEGEGVIACLPAANVDERAYPGARTIDLTRNPRGHLAFGTGLHGCVGQQLARAQIGATLTALFRRFPGLRLAVPLEDLTFSPNFTRTVDRIPVEW